MLILWNCILYALLPSWTMNLIFLNLIRSVKNMARCASLVHHRRPRVWTMLAPSIFDISNLIYGQKLKKKTINHTYVQIDRQTIPLSFRLLYIKELINSSTQSDHQNKTRNPINTVWMESYRLLFIVFKGVFIKSFKSNLLKRSSLFFLVK